MVRMIGLALTLLVLAASSCGGGDAAVGDSCTSGDDCKSGHCIEDAQKRVRRCTGPCTSSADCPAGAPTCDALPFSWAGSSMWCVP
jgi:hypothetical protein